MLLTDHKKEDNDITPKIFAVMLAGSVLPAIALGMLLIYIITGV